MTHTPSIAWWPTLRASLSGTFLQTLPDLVTPLKGQSPHSCPPTRSAPSERFGYWWDCGSNLAPKQARKHEMHPPRIKNKKKKKKRVPSRFKRLVLVLYGLGKQHGNIKQTSNIIWVVCNKLTTVWAPTKKLLVSWQFSGTYGVTKYGNGWRKDVVNQCLEFGSDPNSPTQWFTTSFDILPLVNPQCALSCHQSRVNVSMCQCDTHRASPLSGTFLQTSSKLCQTGLITPLKGHSLSPRRSCPPTRSAPSEKFGY